MLRFKIIQYSAFIFMVYTVFFFFIFRQSTLELLLLSGNHVGMSSDRYQTVFQSSASDFLHKSFADPQELNTYFHHLLLII